MTKAQPTKSTADHRRALDSEVLHAIGFRRTRTASELMQRKAIYRLFPDGDGIYRGVDRSLQRLRKAGLIQFRAGLWAVVGS